MYIADNILKEELKNVYFMSGQACAVKTTLAKFLAKKYKMQIYCMDDMDYRSRSNPQYQPAMNMTFKSWDEYLNRTPKVYSEWLNKSMNEGVDFAILDLMNLSKKGPVVTDCHIPVNVLKGISDYHRSAFLLVDYELVRKDFFNRDDKDDLYRLIMSQEDPKKTLQNVFSAITYDYYPYVNEVMSSGLKYFIRKEQMDYDLFHQEVIKHFKLDDKLGNISK